MGRSDQMKPADAMAVDAKAADMRPADVADRSGARYGRVAMLLHWLVGAAVIGMLILGYFMVDIPKGTPDRGWYFNLHKSIGVLAGLLVLFRVGWRLTHPAPPLPARMPGWEAAAARWSHRLLYVCLVLQPLTGYLASSFNKYGIKVFGLPLPQWAWEDKGLRELFAGLHAANGMLLTALIALHAAAALKHLLLDRDGVFQRMLPSVFAPGHDRS